MRAPLPTLRSYTLGIEGRLLAGAVALERTFIADGIRVLKDPVLPGGEPGKNLRFHGLRPAKAQIGLEAGESVRRKARTLFQKYADLVFPVDLVERGGDETERGCTLGIEHLAELCFRFLERAGLTEKTACKPR